MSEELKKFKEELKLYVEKTKEMEKQRDYYQDLCLTLISQNEGLRRQNEQLLNYEQEEEDDEEEEEEEEVRFGPEEEEEEEEFCKNLANL